MQEIVLKAEELTKKYFDTAASGNRIPLLESFPGHVI